MAWPGQVRAAVISKKEREGLRAAVRQIIYEDEEEYGTQDRALRNPTDNDTESTAGPIYFKKCFRPIR